MSKITIIYKKPYEFPVIMEVEDNLESWQKLVGGYIEIVPFNRENTILVICNEEGKLMQLPYNIPYGNNDILVGNVVFVGNKTPDFRSLTKEEIDYIIEELD